MQRLPYRIRDLPESMQKPEVWRKTSLRNLQGNVQRTIANKRLQIRLPVRLGDPAAEEIESVEERIESQIDRMIIHWLSITS